MTEPRRRIYMKLHWSHTLLGVVLLLGIPSGLLLHSYSSLLRNQSFQETQNSAADLARRVERVRESLFLYSTLVSTALSYQAKNLQISPGTFDLPPLPPGEPLCNIKSISASYFAYSFDIQ